MNGKNPELTVEAKVATKKNAGKGRTPKSPVWKVLDDARKKFNAQIVKSTSVKRECIKACIGKYYADVLTRLATTSVLPLKPLLNIFFLRAKRRRRGF